MTSFGFTPYDFTPYEFDSTYTWPYSNMAKKLPPAYLLGEFQFNLNFKNGCVVALYIVDSTPDWTVVPTSAKEPSSSLGTIVPPYISEKKTINHHRIHNISINPLTHCIGPNCPSKV